MTMLNGIRQRAISALLNAYEPVARPDLRALLPRGKTRDVGLKQWATKRQRGETAGINTITKAFQVTLYDWEKYGWIKTVPSTGAMAAP